MRHLLLHLALAIAAIGIAGCNKPQVGGLRDSFARQLAANEFVKDLERRADDLTFSGPDIRGRTARWRVHIDSAQIEPTDNPAQPFKGTVKSSWYADGHRVEPSDGDSNLPLELTDNGIAQDCWAVWDKAAGRWSWE